jgi:hypothetical protein
MRPRRWSRGSSHERELWPADTVGPAMTSGIPSGALPLLADRIKAFLLASPPQVPEPDPVASRARLYYDLAGSPFPRQVPFSLFL